MLTDTEALHALHLSLIASMACIVCFCTVKGASCNK
jgi:hypothetical protein